MKGLSARERAAIERGLNDSDLGPGDAATPDDIAMVDQLIARGLMRWVSRRRRIATQDGPGEESWDEAVTTPLGRVAYECDSLARGVR